MSEAISILNTVAPLILLAIAFGVVLGVIRLKGFLFFVFLIVSVPFIGSAIFQLLSTGLSSYRSWESVFLLVLIGFIALRFFIRKKDKK